MFQKYKKRTAQHGEMTLQITSLADIFTIILVFLLKSYSLQAFEITPSAAIQLPVAHGQDLKSAAHTLEIGFKHISLDNEPILDTSDLSGPNKNLLGSKIRQLLEKDHELTLAILAEKTLPFKSVKNLLSFVSESGVKNAKLTILQSSP